MSITSEKFDEFCGNEKYGSKEYTLPHPIVALTATIVCASVYAVMECRNLSLL